MKMRNALLLFVLTVLLFTVACGGKDNNASKDNAEASNNENNTEEPEVENLNTDSDMPIVDEEIELDIFVASVPDSSDWNDVFIWNEYEEMTNIKTNWEQIPSNSIDEKRNLTLASNSLPDVFYASGIPPLDIFKYGEQGTLLELNDLIEDHAPNIRALFEKYPTVEKALTFPDGNIYSLPGFYSPEFPSLLIGNRPWINEKWLEEFDIDNPETTEEFYEYLKLIDEKDPAGDGKTIPYGGSDIDHLVGWLRGSFGVSTTGVGYIDQDPEEDKVRFYPVADGYKEMLQYINKLYEEELIEQNIFSIEQDQYLANAAEGRYGSTVFWTPADLFGPAGPDYVGGLTLEGPHGDKKFAFSSYPAYNIGKFVMTNANEHPEATMRWVDYFYGDEGSLMMFMGIEGETYEITEDGDYEFMDHIKNSDEGLTLDQEVAKYLTWVVGTPSVLKEEYFQGSERHPSAIAAAEAIEPDLVEEMWPAFLYTSEESKRLSSLEGDIHKYADEAQDLFISGRMSFDKWDEYVEKIENMGLEEYLEIKNEAYDRYKED